MQKEDIEKILQELAIEFAEDIREYVCLGGKLETLTASNVYQLIEQKGKSDS